LATKVDASDLDEDSSDLDEDSSDLDGVCYAFSLFLLLLQVG